MLLEDSVPASPPDGWPVMFDGSEFDAVQATGDGVPPAPPHPAFGPEPDLDDPMFSDPDFYGPVDDHVGQGRASEAGSEGRSRGGGGSGRDGGSRSDRVHVPSGLTEVDRGRLVGEVCRILAASEGMLAEDVAGLLRQARRSTPLLSVLSDGERDRLVGLINLMLYEADMVVDGGLFTLANLPRERLYGPDVRALLGQVRAAAEAGDHPQQPHRHLATLEEEIQRARSARSVSRYLDSLARKDDTDRLLELFRRFEPPTTSRAVENQTFSRTAADWEAEELAARAGRQQIRISSGYRALDVAMTREGESLGAWAGGELHVIAAPTGNGKSAHSRRTLAAAAEDLVSGWGLSHARIYHAITEEEPSIVAAAAELLRGQRFHHLAGNVTIARIGASRTRLIKGLYDLVVQADDEARDTGRPIVEFLPYMVIIDYIGGIVEDGEPADTVAIEKSANLAMRGIAAWDFEMMAQFSGVSFAEYAGRPVPRGMEHHRCAVVAYAQTLSKVDGRLWYEPGSSATPVGDFTVEKPDGSLGWTPLKGDFRVPQRKDVRGSGVLLNHATSLIILHRSRPENNEVRRRDDGLVHVDDDRARFILAKVRNASSMPFVPMRFDSQRNGPRGQFYDLVAEQLIRQGALECAPCHREEGDPILPIRPARRPLAGVRY